MKIMKKTFICLIMLMAVASYLRPDVYIKQQTQVSAYEMLGQKQAEKIDFTEQWIGENLYAQIRYLLQKGEDQREKKILINGLIIDLSAKTLTLLNHKEKTYVVTSLPLKVSTIMPPQVSEIVSTVTTTAKVNPNGQIQKIGEWTCSGYDVLLNVAATPPVKLQMTAWASTDVPFQWEDYQEQLFPIIKKATALLLPIDDVILKEFEKIKGFQIAAEMTTTVMSNTVNVKSSVLEINADKPAPADIYSIPEDYRKKEQLSRMDLMNQ